MWLPVASEGTVFTFLTVQSEGLCYSASRMCLRLAAGLFPVLQSWDLHPFYPVALSHAQTTAAVGRAGMGGCVVLFHLWVSWEFTVLETQIINQ